VVPAGGGGGPRRLPRRIGVLPRRRHPAVTQILTAHPVHDIDRAARNAGTAFTTGTMPSGTVSASTLGCTASAFYDSAASADTRMSASCLSRPARSVCPAWS
jgi:hypothetical protein